MKQHHRFHESVLKLAVRAQDLIDQGYRGKLEVIFTKDRIEGWHKKEFEIASQMNLEKEPCYVSVKRSML